jgi:hypothetical protein
MSIRVRRFIVAAVAIWLVAGGGASATSSTVRSWWSQTVGQSIEDAERSMVIPDNAPWEVTVICRERFHEAGVRFTAHRGERVTCPNDATPHWKHPAAAR